MIWTTTKIREYESLAAGALKTSLIASRGLVVVKRPNFSWQRRKCMIKATIIINVMVAKTTGTMQHFLVDTCIS